jgi:hypothetical protein
MAEVGFNGLADRDEGSVDLADEVRVMLGAFLWPRVGLVVVGCRSLIADRHCKRNLWRSRSMIAHRWFGDDLDLTRTEKHAMVRFASEILDTLDCSVVLADGFAQFDADPFARGERGGAVETNETFAHGNSTMLPITGSVIVVDPSWRRDPSCCRSLIGGGHLSLAFKACHDLVGQPGEAHATVASKRTMSKGTGRPDYRGCPP